MINKNIIVFTIDHNYLPHLATALMSFVDRHHDPKNITVGLIVRGIPHKDIEILVDFFAALGLDLVLYNVDNFLGDIKVGYHFNQIIFYRFLAPELFTDYNKILYIDSDILFLEPILEIFDLDLGPSTLGAIEKTSFSGVPTHLKNYIERYFASGLLLIDTQKFINNKIKDKCINFLRNYDFEMPDQDALSFVVRDFIAIDPSYSVETAFLNQEASEYDFAKNPKIIQFSGSSKPWHMNNEHPYKKLYWHYRNQTPYKTFLPYYFSILKLIRYITPRSVKNLYRIIVEK